MYSSPESSTNWTDEVKQLLISLACSCLLLVGGCSQDSGSERPKNHAGNIAKRVEAVDAQIRELAYTLERTGSLKAKRRVQLYNQEEGRLVDVRYYEGDAVKKDDLLIQLDDRLLRAELDKARATRRQAKENRNRIKTLQSKRMASDDERLQAVTNLLIATAELDLLQARFEYTRIRAPFNGIVTQRLAEPGDIAPKHTHLMTIIDPATLVIRLELSELALAQLDTGTPVKVVIDALGSTPVAGLITRIFPTVDERTRLGQIEISLSNLPKGIREGQFSRVFLSTPARQRLTLPFNAIRRDKQGEFVYRVMNNKAQQTPVRTGLRQSGLVEILDGIEANDSIIIRGFLGLKDGQPVDVIKPDSIEQASHDKPDN